MSQLAEAVELFFPQPPPATLGVALVLEFVDPITFYLDDLYFE